MLLVPASTSCQVAKRSTFLFFLWNKPVFVHGAVILFLPQICETIVIVAGKKVVATKSTRHSPWAPDRIGLMVETSHSQNRIG